jgi:hypothetical protein
VGLEGCPQVHHLVLRFWLRAHLEVASVVVEPFHVVVVQRARLVGASCMAILIAGPVIFLRLSICVKVGMYRFISKSPFYRTDYTAFA